MFGKQNSSEKWQFRVYAFSHLFLMMCVQVFSNCATSTEGGEGKKREETKAATAAWRSGVVNFDWVTRMNNSWNHNFFMRFFFGIHIFFCLRRRRFERQQNFFFFLSFPLHSRGTSQSDVVRLLLVSLSALFSSLSRVEEVAIKKENKEQSWGTVNCSL